MDKEFESNSSVVDLDTVMKFWADQYEARNGRKILKTEWFVDQHKGKVCFVITTMKDG
jgi:hypothetical protein